MFRNNCLIIKLILILLTCCIIEANNQINDETKELLQRMTNLEKETNIKISSMVDVYNKRIKYLEKRLDKSDLDERKIKEIEKQMKDKLGASAPAGAIVFFARNTAPTGWLEANGSEVSRTMYADLFTAIGTTFGSGDGWETFNLPDLRGEFIRGWSHGREVDKGRAFGSFQWGSDIPMAGYVGVHNWASIPDAYRDRWDFAGNTFDDGMERNISPGETRGGTTFPQHKAPYVLSNHDETDIKSWNVWKGTRPRNVALLACIKY